MSTTTLPAYQNLRLERRDQVTVLFVNRPQVMNAINRETLAEIADAVRAFTADATQGALVVTGQGEKAFISGADINELAPLGPAAAEDISRFGQAVVELLEQSTKPVIAAVNGYAFGGGCELALACDFIYASRLARFALPEVTLGIMPGAGGTQNLPRAVGERRAKELLLTGRPWSADEALRWGMVNRLCEPAQLVPEAVATAKIIAENAPISIRQAKRSMHHGLSLSLADGMLFEIEAYNRMVPTEDRREGVTAFNEKRKPRFKGR